MNLEISSVSLFMMERLRDDLASRIADEARALAAAAPQPRAAWLTRAMSRATTVLVLVLGAMLTITELRAGM